MSQKKDILELEQKFNVGIGFFNNLIKESDWSFVIKLHAVFEAILASAIAEKLNKPELSAIFQHVEMSNKKYGKVSVAKALKIIPNYTEKFIYELSELRNKLVHDIRNVNFTFKEYLSTLDKQQKQKIFNNLGSTIKPELREKYITRKPKQTILSNAVFCLSTIQMEQKMEVGLLIQTL
jgi:hypothetical protein